MSTQSLIDSSVGAEADDQERPIGLLLELTVQDREVIDALWSYPEGAARDEFALRALRIGVLALKQAQGQVDATAVRQEGERLLENVERALSQHQESLNDRLTTQLKTYFDPQDGRFHERIERLIRQDGELEQLLRRHVGDDDSRLTQTLSQHIGDGSPLMRVLDPEAGDGFAAALREVVEEKLHDQRQRVLEQFSLDNKDGALSRFLKEVQQHYDGISGDLTDKIDKAVGEFSLDDENSALSRLVGRVTDAQQTITREFSLDEDKSALSRLRGELVKLLNDQSETNVKFQEEVKVAIGELKARKEEAARSTRHGIEFEECLFSVVQTEAQRSGDVAEFTKSNAGLISRCKVGDAVVELGPDCAAPGARIVLEAKEVQGYDDRQALDELDTARKNRGRPSRRLRLFREVRSRRRRTLSASGEQHPDCLGQRRCNDGLVRQSRTDSRESVVPRRAAETRRGSSRPRRDGSRRSGNRKPRQGSRPDPEVGNDNQERRRDRSET